MPPFAQVKGLVGWDLLTVVEGRRQFVINRFWARCFAADTEALTPVQMNIEFESPSAVDATNNSIARGKYGCTQAARSGNPCLESAERICSANVSLARERSE